MLNQNFIDTLKLISERLDNNDVVWAIVGSTNLSLQGLDIIPRDIDIIVTIDNLVKMKDVFAGYEVAEIEEKKSASSGSYWRVAMKINDLEIEFLGEKGQGIYTHNLLGGKKINVLLDDTTIVCLSLESELQAYQETNRLNRVEIIEQFLVSQANK